MAKVVREIPAGMSRVDLKTGKETHELGSWKVMPPSRDCCQICAVKHDEHEPHNAQSLYYRMIFQQMIGRPPTWADALAHCSAPVKEGWERELRARKVWSQPPNGETPVKHHGVE